VPEREEGESSGRRKNDDDWDNLSARGGIKANGEPGGGTYHFDAFVNKVIEWAAGRESVVFRVNQWDRATNRSGPHHGRPIEWRQNMHDKVIDRMSADNPDTEDRGKAQFAYSRWRRDIVGLYTACGWPESDWAKGEDGNPKAPYDEFFAHQCKDGVFVPIMFRMTVVVEPKRERWPEIRALAPITVNGNFVQAPMPFFLPPAAATRLGWTIADTDTWKDGTTVAKIDRESVILGHLNLPTYKEI
jgi:hypothetical protein